MLEFEIFDKESTVECGINVRAGPSAQPAAHCQVSLQPGLEYIHYPAPAPWPRQTLDTADTRGQVEFQIFSIFKTQSMRRIGTLTTNS